MANHVRQQIREAAATLLAGLTTTGARVYQSRLDQLADADLPCLLINTGDEDIEPITIHGTPDLERQLELTVRCVAKDTSDLDDTLDTMAKEVETVLGASVMTTLIKGLPLLTGIRTAMDNGLESPVGVASLNYRVTYVTASNAPDVAR